MITKSTAIIGNENPFGKRAKRFHQLWKLQFVVPMLLMFTSCKSPTFQLNEAADQAARRPEAIVLREGDTVRITFPGTPNLDTPPQQVRRDGKIALPLINDEIKAAGMTPAELEKVLTNRYSTELVSKEVKVTVVSSSYVVYVTGAVLRPGKIASDHPISALEAIMEAGGFDYTRANLKTVTVIRHEGGAAKKYTLNLKNTLRGLPSEPFYLKPSDIVYVPERFTWF